MKQPNKSKKIDMKFIFKILFIAIFMQTLCGFKYSDKCHLIQYITNDKNCNLFLPPKIAYKLRCHFIDKIKSIEKGDTIYIANFYDYDNAEYGEAIWSSMDTLQYTYQFYTHTIYIKRNEILSNIIRAKDVLQSADTIAISSIITQNIPSHLIRIEHLSNDVFRSVLIR